MNSVDYSENICQAIDVIVKKAISELAFDITVQGYISKILGSNKYRVQSLDQSFVAYDKNEIGYDINENVYVLIPKNDFSQDKIILGSKKANDTSELKNYIDNIKDEVSNTNTVQVIDTTDYVTEKTLEEEYTTVERLEYELENYVTIADMTTQIQDYIKENYESLSVDEDKIATLVDAAIEKNLSDYVKSSQIKNFVNEDTLENYVTTSSLANTLKSYAKTAVLGSTNSKLSEVIAALNYFFGLGSSNNEFTKADIQSKSKLSNLVETSDLNDYIKSSALNDYVKSSTLSNYVKNSDLNDYVKKTTLSSYATQTYVQKQIQEAIDSSWEASY